MELKHAQRIVRRNRRSAIAAILVRAVNRGGVVFFTFKSTTKTSATRLVDVTITSVSLVVSSIVAFFHRGERGLTGVGAEGGDCGGGGGHDEVLAPTQTAVRRRLP